MCEALDETQPAENDTNHHDGISQQLLNCIYLITVTRRGELQQSRRAEQSVTAVGCDRSRHRIKHLQQLSHDTSIRMYSMCLQALLQLQLAETSTLLECRAARCPIKHTVQSNTDWEIPIQCGMEIICCIQRNLGVRAILGLTCLSSCVPAQ